jgi:hypothetical protein
MANNSAASEQTAHAISTYNEKPLHAALKAWYARPGDRLEVPVDGFVIDIVRGSLLVEIQTGNFAALKRKLGALVIHHPVRLVYPVAREKWLVRFAGDGDAAPGRRKSPKRGAYVQVFEELVSIPGLLCDPNFSLEVLLIQEEEVRRRDRSRGWRRKGWVIDERRLLGVVDGRRFETPADLVALLPPLPAGPFTTSDLAGVLARPRRFAQKVAYCLREMGAIEPVGKRGNAVLYIPALNRPGV